MKKLTPAAEVFDKHAENYQERFMDVSVYADSFDEFCKYIPNHGEVLELACGPGNITKYLLQIRPDLKILGTDLSPKMIELARTNNPTATFEIFDSRELDQIDKKYDALIAGFCLPYLSAPEVAKLLEDAASLLKLGGVFYISTMEENENNKTGLKTSSYGDQLHMYYYQADDLMSVLQLNGFEILDKSRRETVSYDGSITLDLLLISRKK